MRDRVPRFLFRTALVLLHFAVVFQAAGCEPGDLVAAAVETHVNKDGSAERRVLVDASPPGPKLVSTRRWSIPEGLDAKGGSVSRSRTFENLAAGPDVGGMSLEVRDRFLWREYAFSDRPDGVLEAGRGISGEMGYKLVMPGRIADAPRAMQATGSVAIYTFDAGEALEVRAESWSLRWWAVAVTAAGLLAVGALVLGGRAAEVVKALGRWLWTGEFRAVERD